MVQLDRVIQLDWSRVRIPSPVEEYSLEFVRLFEGLSNGMDKNFYLSYDLRRRCNSTSKN